MSSAIDELVKVEPALASLDATAFHVLSLDVGTSGVRAALFNQEGIEYSSARVGRNRVSLADFTELDANTIVDEVFAAIDQLLSANAHVTRIDVIAISAFWHSLLGVDESGAPTTPLLTWADTRATKVAKSLRAEFNESDIHNQTGCRFHSSYWPAKLRWLQQEDGDAFNRTSQWLGFAEYLSLKMFDEPVASVSMASATGLMNQRTCEWDWDFIRALNVGPESLPPITQTIDPPLSARFVKRWPALGKSRLRAIVGDGAANNVGGGCFSKDKLALMIGTSGAMRVVFEGQPPEQLPSSLWSYRVDQKRVAIGGALSDGGGLYRWLIESLVVDTDPAELTAALSVLEPDAHGLTILPFWSGERSTGWSGDSRGAILGLTQQTTTVEIVRAALESIAYRFALIDSALATIAPNAKIIATGNALRSSPIWLQIISDVLGKPIMFGGTPEASIRGAALLALEAVGKIGAIGEVTASIDEVFDPDMDRHVRYRRALARQEEFYRKLIS